MKIVLIHHSHRHGQDTYALRINAESLTLTQILQAAELHLPLFDYNADDENESIEWEYINPDDLPVFTV